MSKIKEKDKAINLSISKVQDSYSAYSFTLVDSLKLKKPKTSMKVVIYTIINVFISRKTDRVAPEQPVYHFLRHIIDSWP